MPIMLKTMGKLRSSESAGHGADGSYTRPQFARFDSAAGRFSKSFALPVEDPDDNDRRMLSYNIPEFSAGPVKESPAFLRRLVDRPFDR